MCFKNKDCYYFLLRETLVWRTAHTWWTTWGVQAAINGTLCWSAIKPQWKMMERRSSHTTVTLLSHLNIDHLLFDLKYVHTVSPKLIVLFLPDVCKNCDHVIASHEYTFSVVDEYQVKCHMYYRIKHHSWLNKYFCLACPWFLLLCRSTLCSACCVERQRTPSVCYLMTPDSLHRCSSCSSFKSQPTFFTLSRDSKCPNCFFDSC